jgi:hypothetical protein
MTIPAKGTSSARFRAGGPGHALYSRDDGSFEKLIRTSTPTASMTQPDDTPQREGAMVFAGANRPILIFGLTPRTGTNYLWDLFRLHSACAPGREPIREDFFLECSDLLTEFVESVRSRWDPTWGAVSQQTVAELYASLGAALVGFLTVEDDRRLVTKNPSVTGIDQVFSFFPTAQVIILVRDGRAVVESCMRTFGWDADLAARRWAAAATIALRFLDGRDADDPSVRMVRYEDLVADPRGQITQLLSFLGLDTADYDMSAAERLPVRGSSVFLGGKSRVHWEPVERTRDFDPLQRWAHWTADQHRRFAWLAGRQQVALGYGLDYAMADTASARAWQRLASARWRARRGANLGEYRLRGWLGPPTKPLRRRLRLTRDS